MEFGGPVAGEGHRFSPEEELRNNWPEAVIIREAKRSTGELSLADQTVSLTEIL